MLILNINVNEGGIFVFNFMGIGDMESSVWDLVILFLSVFLNLVSDCLNVMLGEGLANGIVCVYNVQG